MLIGAHVSVAGGVETAVGRQVDAGGNCGQIFTHSPQVWEDPNLTDSSCEQFREEAAEHSLEPWVIHSAYLVNLASPDEELRERSVDSMQAEVDAAVELGVKYVNTHIGAHTGAGVEAGLDNAVTALDELDVPDDVTVVVESDAGSGSQLGDDFDHLATVVEQSDQELEVCLDTAHTFAAGYDLSSEEAVDAVVTEFDRVVGLENLACIHLNDSEYGCGTNQDEHAHLGEGELGDEGIEAILTHPELRDLPFILETPNEEDQGFAWDVAKARDLRGEVA